MTAANVATRTGFKCLAIETSQPGCSVAATNGGRIGIREYGAPGEQSRRVFASVREVLDEMDLALAELDCIAFGCGPGGFTGLRIGAAVAQSLAYGAGVPVCRVSSLAVLAAGALRDTDAEAAAACFDARMGEAYFGIYGHDVAGGLQTLVEDQLVDPASFAIPRDVAAVAAAGGGWAAFPEMLERNAASIVHTDASLLPRADALLGLAEIEFRAGRIVPPGAAIPNYVRNQVTS